MSSEKKRVTWKAALALGGFFSIVLASSGLLIVLIASFFVNENAVDGLLMGLIANSIFGFFILPILPLIGADVSRREGDWYHFKLWCAATGVALVFNTLILVFAVWWIAARAKDGV